MRLLPVLLLFAAPCLGQIEDVLVPEGATWRYRAGLDFPVGWTGATFNDSGWASGPAQLGYGDGDEATDVTPPSSTPQARAKVHLFRHSFHVPDPSLYVGMSLRLLRDDGAAVHVNGVEVLRSNLEETAPLGPDTLARRPVLEGLEQAWFTFGLDAALLQTGSNVIAVSVHQEQRLSPDLSFDLELIARDVPALTRAPYLQRGSDQEITVRWSVVPAAPGRLLLGTAQGQWSLQVDAPGAALDHELRVTGLATQTDYFYSVGIPGRTLAEGPEHRFRTAPPVGDDTPLRVWVLGDSGSADSTAAAVRDAYLDVTGAAHTDLWLMLGDNAYPAGSALDYREAVFEMYEVMLRRAALFSTRGNHETDAGVYYDTFTLPSQGECGGVPSTSEAYYSFDFGMVHFVCLDSHKTNRAVGAPMHQWLEQDLAANQQPWTVAFWHHPPYSKGSHNSDFEFNSVDMRGNFLPLLEAHGVDLVLAGHSHGYERSFLINGHYGGSWTLTDDMVLDGGTGREDEGGAYLKGHVGTIYVVGGSSGLAREAPYNHPVMIESGPIAGSVVLLVERGRLRLEFVDEEGEVRDLFTLLDPAWVGAICQSLPDGTGCVATMGAVGVPSMGGGSFTLTLDDAPPGRPALLVYGTNPTKVVVEGGYLCVGSPKTRLGPWLTTGAGACGGRYSLDFGTHLSSGVDPALQPGVTLWTQYWYRDATGSSGWSDGWQFTVLP